MCWPVPGSGTLYLGRYWTVWESVLQIATAQNDQWFQRTLLVKFFHKITV
jgi:hypothetical protein